VRLHALGLHLRNGAPADYSLKRQKSSGPSYRLFEMSSHNWWIQGRLRCQRVVRRNRAPQEPRAIKTIGHAIAMLQLGPARQLREYPVCRRNCRWAVWLQGPGLGEGGAVGRGRAAERERGARGRGVCVIERVAQQWETVSRRSGASGHAHGRGVGSSKPRRTTLHRTLSMGSDRYKQI